MNRPTAIAILAACLAMTGCAGGERTYAPSDPRMKIDGFYNDGAAGRPIQLVVIGNPFNMPPDAFARVVEADLKTSAMIKRGPTYPQLHPGEGAKPLYRLVYAFGQPNPVYGNTLCRIDESDAKPVAPSNLVFATAAFCVGGRAEAFISGDAQADGPGDVRFYRLTRQMMDEVFRPDVHQEASPPPVRTP